MECSKCKSELPSGSKFCNKCGAKAEEYDLVASVRESIRDTQNHWFLFGFTRGYFSGNKKLRKSFDNIEKELEKKCPEIWPQYKEAKEFTINSWMSAFDNKKIKETKKSKNKTLKANSKT